MSTQATFSEGLQKAIGALLLQVEDPSGALYAQARYGPIGTSAANVLTAEQRACALAVEAATAVHAATAEGYVEVVAEWRCLSRALLRLLSEATGRDYIDLLQQISHDLALTPSTED